MINKSWIVRAKQSIQFLEKLYFVGAKQSFLVARGQYEGRT
jgi:hypothetical protein